MGIHGYGAPPELTNYHLASLMLKPGAELTGNGKPKVALEVEEALEERRPADKLSRLSSVFTVREPRFERLGLAGGYVHKVRVGQPYQWHDAFWLGMLQMAALKRKAGWDASKYLQWDDALLDRCGESYWQGMPSQKPVWECLSSSAIVETLISERFLTVEEAAALLIESPLPSAD